MNYSLVAILLLLLVGSILLSCSAPIDGSDQQRQSRTASHVPDQPKLAEPVPEVQTVQLYRGDDERQLPVLPLNSSATLTLTFDLLETSGRPLSVHFYHADRRWQRNLSPSEYMRSFNDDNLFDYRPSRGTDVDYVHYSYTFPNDQIGFTTSGNYVLRVTEQGDENAIIFEKAFYVAEQAGAVSVDVEPVVLPGRQHRSQRPVVRYQPPSSELTSPHDYHLCVIRNGRASDVRCTGRARLGGHPTMLFEIERENAFPPLRPVNELDLSRLQQGPQIERIDRQERPPRVLLAPDHAQFPRRIGSGPLHGQSAIRGAGSGLSDPGVEAEYVLVRFSYVPREGGAMQAPLYLSGSFSPVSDRPVERLEWREGRQRYEAETLVKQGRHEYRYIDGNDTVQQPGERTEMMPSQFLALVYFRDVRLNTDRLVAAQTSAQPF